MFDNIQFDNISTTMNTQPYFQQGLIMIVRNTSSLTLARKAKMKPVTAIGMKKFGRFNLNNPFNL